MDQDSIVDCNNNETEDSSQKGKEASYHNADSINLNRFFFFLHGPTLSTVVLISAPGANFQLISVFKGGAVVNCVVPENIHTPTAEGISLTTPLLPGFSVFFK